MMSIYASHTLIWSLGFQKGIICEVRMAKKTPNFLEDIPDHSDGITKYFLKHGYLPLIIFFKWHTN